MRVSLVESMKGKMMMYTVRWDVQSTDIINGSDLLPKHVRADAYIYVLGRLNSID